MIKYDNVYCLAQCLFQSKNSLNCIIIENLPLKSNTNFALFLGVYAGKIQRKRPNVATI